MIIFSIAIITFCLIILIKTLTTPIDDKPDIYYMSGGNYIRSEKEWKQKWHKN